MTAIEIIRANPGLTAPELAAKYGKRTTFFWNAACTHGFRLPNVSEKVRVERVRQGVRRRYDCDRNERFMREHFGTMLTSDIARALGIKRSTAFSIAKRLGLRRTEAQNAALRPVLAKKRTDSLRAKRAVKIAMQISGLASPTKGCNAFSSPARAKARNRLVDKFGYAYIDEDFVNLGYDSNTNRCTEEHHSGSPLRKPEEFYTRKYGIHFYDLDE